MSREVVVVGLALMMGGCAAQQPPAPPPVKAGVEAPKVVAAPPPSRTEILAALPDEVRDAITEHQQNGKWLVYRRPGYLVGPSRMITCRMGAKAARQNCSTERKKS